MGFILPTFLPFGIVGPVQGIHGDSLVLQKFKNELGLQRIVKGLGAVT